MRSKAFSLIAIGVLLANVAVLGADNKRRPASVRASNQLIRLLPASDAVVTIDSKRFFNTALPTLLAKNQRMLAEIMVKMNQFENQTGIDLRRFDSVVAGLAAVGTPDKNFSVDPVVIARGEIPAAGLVGVAKLASDGKYREERVGDRVVYVFSTTDAAAKAKASGTGSLGSTIEGIVDGISKEMAVTQLDGTTVAFGSLARVRQTIEGQTSVGADIVGLLSQKASSVVTFAVRSPSGMSAVLPLDDDELGKNIDAIRYMSGTMDVTAAGASVYVMARTVEPQQAQSLSETLEGLKILGKVFLGRSKREDQRRYARLIESIKVAQAGTDVSLDVTIPKADIDAMASELK
ncbi:MAG: hypothetical protein KF736_10740 [Acidobacteria bacterium]|nr:hypothetical protein [Acidobacteriota bacterium]MCW5949600.1 hypothetical protein [Pyrinomonadaceae bacterium]